MVSAWATKRDVDFWLELTGRETSGAQARHSFYQSVNHQLKTARLRHSLTHLNGTDREKGSITVWQQHFSL